MFSIPFLIPRRRVVVSESEASSCNIRGAKTCRCIPLLHGIVSKLRQPLQENESNQASGQIVVTKSFPPPPSSSQRREKDKGNPHPASCCLQPTTDYASKIKKDAQASYFTFWIDTRYFLSIDPRRPFRQSALDAFAYDARAEENGNLELWNIVRFSSSR